VSFLPIGPVPGPPASGVTSWDGRTGAVVPAAGDYTAAQVGAVPASALPLSLANGGTGAAYATLAALLAAMGLTVPAPAATFQPANPAGTSSATLVMMGLGAAGGGQACLYTPAGTGSVIATIRGEYAILTAANNLTLGPRYGLVSGGVPANAAPVTGTRWGAPSDSTVRTASTVGPANSIPFSFTSKIVLVPGNQYWFDLALLTGAILDQVNVQNISFTIAEQLVA